MLETLNLTKEYRTKKGYVTKALKGISVAFPERGMVFVLGKSGSGKSTFLNIIGGMDNPTSGEIVINGRTSKMFTDRDFDSYRNTCIGFIFQEYNLIENYTVGVNIGLSLELQGKKADKAVIDDLLCQVNLLDDNGQTFFDRQVNELSGGQKQRVAIARALIKHPDIILADEPTGALDAENGRQLYELLKDIAKEKLIVVVTHDRESAEKYGDRIIEIKDGEIKENKSYVNVTSASEISQTSKTIEQSFIKSRLPLMRSFKMGASGLRTKPFRLVISVFLSVIALVLFCFSFTASMADKITAELKTLQSKKMNIVILSCSDSNSLPLDWSSQQMDELKKYNNGIDPMVAFDYDYDTIFLRLSNYIGKDENLLEKKRNPYIAMAKNSIDDFIEVDPVTGEEDIKLIPDSRFIDNTICRLPQTFDEVAITDIKADLFLKYGYKAADGSIVEIKTPDDLIGVEVSGYKISGVYSTEQSADYFRGYDEDNFGLTDQDLADFSEWNMIGDFKLEIDPVFQYSYRSASNSIISCGFVRKGFYEYKHGEPTNRKVAIRLSDDLQKNKKLFKDLKSISSVGPCTIKINSAVSNFIAQASFFQEFAFVSAIIAFVFTVFSILMTISYLLTSLDYRKKELGILRALGAGKKDVILICLFESFLIACFEFIISLIGTIITCVIINAYYFVSLFNVGFLSFLLLFLLCFGVAAIATILPVRSLAKKKPVDIINDK